MSLNFDQFSFHASKLELRKNGERLPVKPKSLELLAYLLEHRDRVISKDEIFEVVWQGRFVSDAALTTTVKELRRALGDTGKDSRYIRTYYGRGLRFIAPAEHLAFADGISEPIAPAEGTQKLRVEPQLNTDALPSTLAVMPFDVMAKEADAHLLADGLADDLIHALSRYHHFAVIARLSSFALRDSGFDAREIGQSLGARYLLQGTLRLSDNQLRVTIRLSDTSKGTEIWTERYDRAISDLFEIQDEITQLVVAAVAPSVSELERMRSRQKAPSDLTAWENYHRGVEEMYSFETSKQDDAVRFFEKAIQTDPAFSQPYAGKAYALNIKCSGVVYHDGPLFSPGRFNTDLEAAMAAAQTAVRLAPRNALPWFVLSRTEVLRGNSEAAIDAARTAIDLNPFSFSAQIGLAIALLHSGRMVEALEPIETALGWRKAGPFVWVAQALRAEVLALLGEVDGALEYSRLAQAARPTSAVACMGELWVCGQRGDKERAADILMRLRDAGVFLNEGRFDLAQPFTCRKTRDQIHDWLAKAGVPA